MKICIFSITHGEVASDHLAYPLEMHLACLVNVKSGIYKVNFDQQLNKI